MKAMTVAEKIALNKYELDEGHPHIAVHEEACRTECKNLACLMVCPATVYTEVNGKIMADWAACLECGACKAACPSGALEWTYPRCGFGIVYRHG
jgi:ferredoxin like protein